MTIEEILSMGGVGGVKVRNVKIPCAFSGGLRTAYRVSILDSDGYQICEAVSVNMARAVEMAADVLVETCA